MAKILVADDNSNVQKTVTLALADQGIEVVAVNNGEAAVRKLPEVSPDLVLADIFMPVRNGYEVCDYIKKDARFSGVPVVLLVGAFDPLDEREAQRVRADGILKKPFVPPDPLIKMVKTLLDRTASARLVAVSASKAPAAAQSGSTADAPAEAVETAEEMPLQEPPAPPSRVSFGAERPLAFGSLLETPAEEASGARAGVLEPVENEQVLTSQRDSALGEPAFWHDDAADAEPGSETSDGATSEPEAVALEQPQESVPQQVAEPELEPAPPLEVVQEEENLAAGPSIADSKPVELDPAAQGSLSVDVGKAPDLADSPLEWMETAPVELTPQAPEPVSSETEPAASQPGALAEPELETEDAGAPAEQIVASSSVTEAVTPLGLADDWSALIPAVQESVAEVVPQTPAPPSEPEPPTPLAVSLPEAAAPPDNPPQPAMPDPVLVEAVVQRVLDRMRPQVIDIITKEFLRPIIQTLVEQEIKKP